jgi:hypothetical protein
MVIYQVMMPITQALYTKPDIVLLLAKIFVTNNERIKMQIYSLGFVKWRRRTRKDSKTQTISSTREAFYHVVIKPAKYCT